MGKRGQARDIAARFKHDVTDDADDEGRRKPRDMIVIDLASGPSVLENDPQPCRPDVVRSVIAIMYARVRTKSLYGILDTYLANLNIFLKNNFWRSRSARNEHA